LVIGIEPPGSHSSTVHDKHHNYVPVSSCTVLEETSEICASIYCRVHDETSEICFSI
jgi:hypothetical protein